MKIRSGLRFLAATSVVLSGAALVIVDAAPSAGAKDPGAELLDGARAAASNYDFAGIVTIEWRDGAKVHAERVPVIAAGGELKVGKRRPIIGLGARRLVRDESDWLVLWDNRAPDRVSPTEKYNLEVSDGRRVAGRTTTLVEASHDGKVRERLSFDEESGLLLRTQELDRNGKVTRTVGFTRIADLQKRSTTTSTLPKPQSVDNRVAPEPVADVGGSFVAPRRLGDGYELVGRYRLPDGTVQLFYSDGLYGVSIFEEEGTVDWDGLPSGGDGVQVADQRTQQYVTPDGVIVVWNRDGVVFTCVTDAPAGELEGMVQDLARDDDAGPVETIGRMVLSPFSWN